MVNFERQIENICECYISGDVKHDEYIKNLKYYLLDIETIPYNNIFKKIFDYNNLHEYISELFIRKFLIIKNYKIKKKIDDIDFILDFENPNNVPEYDIEYHIFNYLKINLCKFIMNDEQFENEKKKLYNLIIKKLKNLISKIDIINEYLCPISKDIMNEPIRTPYGHNFDKNELEKWLSVHNICPLTKQILYIKDCSVNETLKEEIKEFVKTNTKTICCNKQMNNEYFLTNLFIQDENFEYQINFQLECVECNKQVFKF